MRLRYKSGNISAHLLSLNCLLLLFLKFFLSGISTSSDHEALLLNRSEVQAAHLANLIKKIKREPESDKQNPDLFQALAVTLFT